MVFFIFESLRFGVFITAIGHATAARGASRRYRSSGRFEGSGVWYRSDLGTQLGKLGWKPMAAAGYEGNV